MREIDVTLNGHSFHLREWGPEDAPVLLMLHGFPEYGGAWSDIAPLLSDRFRCVAPDQRGYGQSWSPEGVENYETAKLAGDMAALIELLGRGDSGENGGDDGGDSSGGAPKPVAVLAHDWGASVAYLLAIRRPELVSRLIIANGVHPAPFQRALASGGAQAAASQYITWLRREGSEGKLAADDYDKLMRLFAEDMDMSWMDAERAAIYRREWARPGRLSGMVNWYRAARVQVPPPGETLDLAAFDPAALQVPMPHLLLWGAGDTALLPEATEGLEAYCPKLTRVEVPGTDHWLIHQAPGTVAREILDWMP